MVRIVKILIKSVFGKTLRSLSLFLIVTHLYYSYQLIRVSSLPRPQSTDLKDQHHQSSTQQPDNYGSDFQQAL